MEKVANNKGYQIATSLIEIRFESDIAPDGVLHTFYPFFSKEFYNIKDRGQLRVLKAQGGDFQFLADYIFSNDEYQIYVGNNVFAIDRINRNENWQPFLEKAIISSAILAEIPINKIIQVSIRVSLLFDVGRQIMDVFKPDLKLKTNNGIFQTQKAEYQMEKDDLKVLMQLQNMGQVIYFDGQPPVSGLIFDITLVSGYPSEKFDSGILKTIIQRLFDTVDSISNEMLNK